MHLSSCLLASSMLVGAVSAVSDYMAPFRRAEKVKAKFDEKLAARHAHTQPKLQHQHRWSKRDFQYLTNATAKYAVNGSGIPEVPFDVGESYAGLLPISSKANETRELFFWFFPSENPAASNEITIWFNGGPGCSSLSGLLTENGKFTWMAGTLQPVENAYSWTNLTNMVWIEQPVGVGYSQGTPDITDELGVASEFKGFWKNFVDLFCLGGKDVYITGESYGGYYVPYVADGFINASDTNYFNLKGVTIIDPILGDGNLQQAVALVPYVTYWNDVFYLNSTFLAQIQNASDACGYTEYQDKYLRFPPPPGPFPAPTQAFETPGCDLFDSIYEAALEVNPCFNIYHILDTCPHLYGQLGIVNTGDYEPPAGKVYFNRSDVKAALHAPANSSWYQCTPINVFGGANNNQSLYDTSYGPDQISVLTRVIDFTQNALIGVGELDFLLATNGTLLTIQNTTWGGVQGFQAPINKTFYVPYHPEYNGGSLAGAGELGYYNSERGLTFFTVQLAGHEMPEYAPGAAYRAIEVMLGRVPTLGTVSDFSTQSGNFTGNSTLYRRW